MRDVILIVTLAAICGIVVAWGTASREIPASEDPLAGFSIGTTNSNEAQFPRVVLEGSDTFDFGTMELGTSRAHTFVVKNAGNAPLKLTKGDTSCKCTISNVEEGDIAPGETREVRLEWNAKTAGEEFTQTAEIHTNDPQRTHLKLTIRGRILEGLRIDNTSLALGRFSSSDPPVQEIRLTNFRDEPLTIEKWSLTDPTTADFFKVDISELATDQLGTDPHVKSGKIVRVAIQPGLPLGELKQMLRLEVASSEKKSFEISINGRVTGDLSLIGPQVDREREIVLLGSVARSKGVKIQTFVVVKGTNREDVKLEIASIDPADALKAVLGEPKSSGGRSIIWPLTIEISPEAAPVNRLGTDANPSAEIVLKSTGVEIPEYKIPIRVAVTDE